MNKTDLELWKKYSDHIRRGNQKILDEIWRTYFKNQNAHREYYEKQLEIYNFRVKRNKQMREDWNNLPWWKRLLSEEPFLEDGLPPYLTLLTGPQLPTLPTPTYEGFLDWLNENNSNSSS